MNCAVLHRSVSRQARRTLAGIVILLLLPFAVASGLYLSGWRPARTGNHGLLIEPPVALAVSGARPGQWTGKWSLVLLHDAPCGEACRLRLDELRRLRVALGREMARTRLVWLGMGIAPEAAAMPGRMPDLTTLDGVAAEFSRLPPGSLLVVDPQGRAMLRYPPGAPLAGVRSDLERLLKTSWS